MSTAATHELIQEKYGAIARGSGNGCCAPSACGCGDPISSHLYSNDEKDSVPQEAAALSLGCGNPTALAELKPGQVVLDLGSGGGMDVLLSARRVGPTGKVYGLDMTDDMLKLARENQRRAGATNVEFLKGTIEAIPLPDNSVDVIISNCVINLALDKGAVFREALRVLKPGGRLAVSDVVIRGDVPQEVRRSLELWIGCVAGALTESDYRSGLTTAGFESIEIEPWRIYNSREAEQVLSEAGLRTDALPAEGTLASAFVRAQKPAARTCCGPSCCT